MMYTLNRIEEELQDVNYHIWNLKFEDMEVSTIQAHIAGLIRSAEQIAEYANDLQADFDAERIA